MKLTNCILSLFDFRNTDSAFPLQSSSATARCRSRLALRVIAVTIVFQSESSASMGNRYGVIRTGIAIDRIVERLSDHLLQTVDVVGALSGRVDECVRRWR